MLRFLRYVLASLALIGASQHAYADPVGWLYNFSYDCNSLPAVTQSYGNSDMRSVCKSFGQGNLITFSVVLSDSVTTNPGLDKKQSWNGTVLSFSSSIPGATVWSPIVADEHFLNPPINFPPRTSDEVMLNASYEYWRFTFDGNYIEDKWISDMGINMTIFSSGASLAVLEGPGYLSPGKPVPTKVPAPGTVVLLLVGLLGLSARFNRRS